MVCTEHLLTLWKDKDFDLKLESAMPAVDQPVGEVDKREVHSLEVSTRKERSVSDNAETV
jgi:hypothetical protein